MLKLVLLSTLKHHGEAADPTLLHWIKGVLDQLVGTGPWLVVALLGVVVVAIPVSIVAFYLAQQRRTDTADRQAIHGR
jgi:hypothetical protein